MSDYESSSFILEAGAQAFGNGQHPSTHGVLTALSGIDPAIFTPRFALDMGAGSGILSFAIHARFGCPVVASDISTQAIETLRENTVKNGLARAISAINADGFSHPEITARAPYELIVMNILAAPLLALAHDAQAHLAPGGVLILSGLMLAQEGQISQAYRGLGLELASRIVIGDWVTLCCAKEGAA